MVHSAASAQEEAAGLLAAVAAAAARASGYSSSISFSSGCGCGGGGGVGGACTVQPSTSLGLLRSLTTLFLRLSGMSLLGAYKKKSSYDGYESLQLVDSGGEGFGVGRGSSSSGGGGSISISSSVLSSSIGVSLGAKAAPLREEEEEEEDCSTMDSSGTRPPPNTRQQTYSTLLCITCTHSTMLTQFMAFLL